MQPVSLGDLLLARITRIRQHPRIELPCGRRANLFTDDEVILAAGNRYATDQFAATLPTTSTAHLVAGGGIAAEVVSRHCQVKPATEIEIIGLLADEHQQVLNLSRFVTLNPPPEELVTGGMRILLVVGTGMNSGKTTLATALVSTLSRQSCRVVAAKLTGTGSGPDVWRFLDAGAMAAYDFTDAGLPGTWKQPTERLFTIARQIIDAACTHEAQYLVIELADGILQEETKALIEHQGFLALCDGCFLAADCAPGALMLVQQLSAQKVPILAISGTLTKAPLLIEEVCHHTGLPALTLEQIYDTRTVDIVLGELSPVR
ncbi:hypothetical protein [Pseudomonas benzenivorans]|uniref:DUF1611 domain-containing protein n=1 Tax=Pseudomonas benzenivorans TaxID=556533 RepID=A0ABY5HA69_9PSED|nr:hypothetical protein [Pseudomonas benzenivorans]UTW08284.1 hypothetical protein KDW96_02855 [Pseudomonas benzenivorans]